MITYGRKRIYCEEQEITRENLIKVLRKAYSDHREIRNQIQFLIDYEGGIQPLPRPKEIRPEIDIKVADGAPTYIKEFKQSYFWGTPALLVQRSENENHSDSAAAEDSGINALNEMMRYGNNLPYSNQQLSEFVENTGIGHTIIIPKNHDEIRYENGIPVSVFERSALDSRFAFVVYHEGAILREALGATFFKSRSGKLKFTCYTDKYVWRVENWKIVEEDDPLKNINVLGMIPIVEFERSVDRTGAWEHQISSIDNLNVQISDFANDVSQATQQIWWGDNVNLDDDENGDPKTPKSGEWILTYSTGDR